jgi:hypothetical protein
MENYKRLVKGLHQQFIKVLIKINKKYVLSLLIINFIPNLLENY